MTTFMRRLLGLYVVWALSLSSVFAGIEYASPFSSLQVVHGALNAALPVFPHQVRDDTSVARMDPSPQAMCHPGLRAGARSGINLYPALFDLELSKDPGATRVLSDADQDLLLGANSHALIRLQLFMDTRVGTTHRLDPLLALAARNVSSGAKRTLCTKPPVLAWCLCAAAISVND